ncbi:hypothetical protein Peur_003433 [Populus x canadensis]
MSPYGSVFHALQEIGKNESLKGLYSSQVIFDESSLLRTDNSALVFELKNVECSKSEQLCLTTFLFVSIFRVLTPRLVMCISQVAGEHLTSLYSITFMVFVWSTN